MLLRAVDVAVARIASAESPWHGELERKNSRQQMTLDRCRIGLIQCSYRVTRKCRAGYRCVKALDIMEEDVNRELGWAGILAADNLGQRDQRSGW